MSKISLPPQLRKVVDKNLIKSIQAGLENVETALLEAVTHTDPVANVTSRHLLEAGGKRLRPVLVLLGASLGDATKDEVIKAAVVVELTHLATLYHDDVMDRAPMRRGVPTAHEVWGNSVAILTGDLLFARASQIVSRLGGKALTLQADTFERLCLGQLHETLGPQDGEDPIEHYLQVLADKTGSLIAASAELGVVYGDGPDEYREPLRVYGEKVGVAFQLIDDVIDILSDESGKTPGTDLRAGVPTLPTLLLRAQAATDPKAQELVEIIDAGLEEDAQLAKAVELLRAHPALEEAYQTAKQWADDAVLALAPLPDSPVKDALRVFAEAVVERQK
ncbi:MAG: polyprenyl synthetase family protein [Micrococcales bacterium]|nr:polyprenyl synthetase family protein [Microbacteriaceae bacterium]NBR22443.1 polyprenyl synthetase family protein [Micrococcales bacterium]NBX94916.1 polyprenyl synthetase family protein [Actinomycetota bacterium]NBR77384.1 polyprenyl synthetase family protein [Microbacteriaceae bacterium]NBS60964.1 polyprenyl synthetase family protein [Microbacteriaceae bacterium]